MSLQVTQISSNIKRVDTGVTIVQHSTGMTDLSAVVCHATLFFFLLLKKKKKKKTNKNKKPLIPV